MSFNYHFLSKLIKFDLQLKLLMKSSPVFKHIYFDYFSATPKYLQLANSIIKAIEEGKLQEDDVLPSINELSFEFEISRDTAEKGYKHLKKPGHPWFGSGQRIFYKEY